MNTEDYIFAYLWTAALIIFLVFMYIGPTYIWAYLSGCYVSPLQIVSMKLRRTPVLMIAKAKKILQNEGISVTLEELEATYLVNKSPIKQPQQLADAFQLKQ